MVQEKPPCILLSPLATTGIAVQSKIIESLFVQLEDQGAGSAAGTESMREMGEVVATN